MADTGSDDKRPEGPQQPSPDGPAKQSPAPPADASADHAPWPWDGNDPGDDVVTATVALPAADAASGPTRGPGPGNHGNETGDGGGGRESNLDDEVLSPGTAVGRYQVSGMLGTGGVGMVYAAHDPALDRKVAIKFLRRSKSRQSLELGQRLMREAQIVAQLSHPNIVSVFDVGAHEGQIYVAMELVQGQNAREWLREPRSWRQILDMYMAAGRGLAAAHAAGIIHRDFKPDNVIIGDDGRVRVLDFGIAAPAGRDRDMESTTGDVDSLSPAGEEGPTRPGSSPASGSFTSRSFTGRSQTGGSRSGSDQLTSPGAILGTPAYMAPEQHLAQPIDARADQFAFCVALYEALFDQRPFHSSARSRNVKLQQLCAAKLAGRVRPPPPTSRVPAWLRRVVMRGMAGDANERWPSMDALLAQLARDAARVRRRWLGRAVVAMSVVASAIALAAVLHRGAGASPCGDASAHLRGVWDEDVTARARAAVLESGLPYAAGTWTRIEPLLADYVRKWRAGYADACEATHVHGSQSSALMDRRMACLHTRLDRLRTLSRLLLEADATVIENASNAVRALPPVDDCADVERLVNTMEPPADPALRATVDGLREELATAAVLADAGREGQALARARAAAERAATIEYLPVRAEAWLRVGLLERRRGDFASARKALDEALWAAEATGHDEVAAPALVELVRLGEDEEVASFTRRAEAAIRRSGKSELRAHLADAKAVRCLGQEDNACALEWAQRAVDRWQDARGLDNVQAVRYLNNLGVAYSRSGDIAGGLARYRRALSLAEGLLGKEHPLVGFLNMNIASDMVLLGQYEAAETQAREALRIARSLGTSHRHLALCLYTLAEALVARGAGDEALPLALEARSMWEQLGFEDAYRAPLLVGRAHAVRGDVDLAVEHYRRALAASEEEHGAAHTATANARRYLGGALRAQGDPAAARKELEAALAIFMAQKSQTRLGEWDLAAVYHELGRVAEDEGSCPEALAHYDRALAIRARALSADHPHQVDTLLGMARCHLASARPNEAAAVLEHARDIVDARGTGGRDERGDARMDEIRRLLQEIGD